jgi:hypothetical protein
MNGTPATFLVFSGFPPFMAPPIVQDQNVKSFLTYAPTSGSSIGLYAGQNLDNPSAGTLTHQADIPVPAYTMPSDAHQCNPPNGETIQTLDSRFENAGTQYGTALWQVHTTGFSATLSNPTPRFYQINTSNNTITQTGQFFRSTTSDDFNASITATSSGRAFVTYSSTDQSCPPSPLQIRFSGREPTDPLGQIGAGSALNPGSGSPVYAAASGTSQRWGDYSAITIDPSVGCGAGLRAWLVNEMASTTTLWGSRIAGVGYC